MSSYYDAAAQTHAGLPTVEDKIAFAAKVSKRTADYLDYIEKHSPKDYQQKVFDLKQRFTRLAVVQGWDSDGGFLIQNMHTLGHEIGTARIPRKYVRGITFGDSPMYEGHFGNEEAG